MRRLLVLGLLVLGLLWWLRRAFRSLQGAAAGSGASQAGARRIRGQEMVRDRVCNTFLPLDRALTDHDESGQAVHFCSERCRADWRQRRAAG